MEQSKLITRLKNKNNSFIIKEYFNSKHDYTYREIIDNYHKTTGYNHTLYLETKSFFDNNIANKGKLFDVNNPHGNINNLNGKALHFNQRGLDFQGYQRLIAISMILYNKNLI